MSVGGPRELVMDREAWAMKQQGRVWVNPGSW